MKNTKREGGENEITRLLTATEHTKVIELQVLVDPPYYTPRDERELLHPSDASC